MTRISLLPPEIKYAHKKRRNQRLALMIGVFIVVLFIMFYSGFSFSLRAVESQLRQVEAQRSQVEQRIDDLQEYEEMQRRMETAEELLLEAMGSPPNWPEFLADFSGHLPYQVYVENLSAANGGEEEEIILQGSVPNHEGLARLLKNLEEVPGLENVNCRSSSGTTANGSFAVNFEITATMLPGEPYTPPVEGGL